MASDSTGHEEALQTPLVLAHKARGIIDISQMTLVDIPLTIEEKLRKTKGVFSVQINAFSKKLAIEFDPSIISLDEIVRKISRAQSRREDS
jgi:cation transport ATPase